MNRTVLWSILIAVITAAAFVFCLNWNQPPAGDTVLPKTAGPAESEQADTTPEQPSSTAESYDRIVLPVRVHLVQAADERIDAVTTKQTIIALLADANERYWKQAGIEWHLESVLVEDAASEKEFVSALKTAETNPAAAERQLPTAFRSLINEDEMLSGGFNIYIVHTSPAQGGGLYAPGLQAVFIPETSEKGGLVSFAFAHELGHSLTLPHYAADPYNLMAVGNPSVYNPADKTRLTAAQIAAARAQAETGLPATQKQMAGQNSALTGQ